MHELLFENMKFEVGWYFSKTLEILNRSEQWIQSSSEDVIQEHEGNEAKAFFDHRGFDLRNTYPQLARRSAFLIVYFFAEEWLDRLCDSLATPQRRLKLRDLAGTGISRALKYLEKVEGFTIPSILSNGENLQFLARLRNSITHNGGRIPKGQFEKMNIWKSKNDAFKNVEIQVPTNRIIFHKDSVENIADLLRMGLEDLIQNGGT